MTFQEAVVAGLVGFEWAVLGYFILVNVVYGILLVAAAAELRRVVLRTRGRSMERLLSSPLVPTISVLAPAHNEEATVVASVGALLSLHYSNLEVVVVNDGSTDRTLEVLEDAFELVATSSIHRRRLDTQPVRER